MGYAIIIPDANYSDGNLGKVTKVERIEIEGLSIVANGSYEGDTASLSVSYNPENTSQKGVIWSIVSGGEYASIAQDGVLTIAPSAYFHVIEVKAASKVRPSLFDIKTIKVMNQVLPTPDYEIDKTGFDSVVDTGLDLLSEYRQQWTCYLYVGLSSNTKKFSAGGNQRSTTPWEGIFINQDNVFTDASVDFGIVPGISAGSIYLQANGTIGNSNTNGWGKSGRHLQIAIQRNGNVISYSMNGETWNVMCDDFKTSELTMLVGGNRDSKYAKMNGRVKFVYYNRIVQNVAYLFE